MRLKFFLAIIFCLQAVSVSYAASTWELDGTMVTPRSGGHTATLMLNGKGLVCGA